MKYDIFISYRREGGYDTAKHLNDLLVRDGYRVSFDIDTLRKGDFDTQLLSRIEECRDFILIVDQHAFDRTLDPKFDPKKDWLRCELAHALKLNKNIIPIFLSGVSGFPDGLPADIVNVVKKNCPEYNRYYFNDFYKTLKKRFLHKRNNYKIIFWGATILLIGAFILIINNQSKRPEVISNEVSENNTVEYRNEDDLSDDNAAIQRFIEAQFNLCEPEYGVETGCYQVDEVYIGRIVSYTNIDEDPIKIRIKGLDNIVHKFYLDANELCNADKSWLPYILVENNKVAVQYYLSGNGGYRYVISMKNVK